MPKWSRRLKSGYAVVEITLALLLGLLGGWNANELLTPDPEPVIDYCEHSTIIEWNTEQELRATPIPITRQIVENNTVRETLCPD